MFSAVDLANKPYSDNSNTSSSVTTQVNARELAEGHEHVTERNHGRENVLKDGTLHTQCLGGGCLALWVVEQYQCNEWNDDSTYDDDTYYPDQPIHAQLHDPHTHSHSADSAHHAGGAPTKRRKKTCGGAPASVVDGKVDEDAGKSVDTEDNATVVQDCTNHQHPQHEDYHNHPPRTLCAFCSFYIRPLLRTLASTALPLITKFGPQPLSQFLWALRCAGIGEHAGDDDDNDDGGAGQRRASRQDCQICHHGNNSGKCNDNHTDNVHHKVSHKHNNTESNNKSNHDNTCNHETNNCILNQFLSLALVNDEKEDRKAGKRNTSKNRIKSEDVKQRILDFQTCMENEITAEYAQWVAQDHVEEEWEGDQLEATHEHQCPDDGEGHSTAADLGQAKLVKEDHTRKRPKQNMPGDRGRDTIEPMNRPMTRSWARMLQSEKLPVLRRSKRLKKVTL